MRTIRAAGLCGDGLFRLDCQPIDAGCSNDSWHSHAHKIESGFTAGATFLALVLVALASGGFRTGATRGCRRGAATRAGKVTVFLAIAFIGFRLISRRRDAALPVGSDDRRLAEGGTP
jgi:hypothetical protein